MEDKSDIKCIKEPFHVFYHQTNYTFGPNTSADFAWCLYGVTERGEGIDFLVGKIISDEILVVGWI